MIMDIEFGIDNTLDDEGSIKRIRSDGQETIQTARREEEEEEEEQVAEAETAWFFTYLRRNYTRGIRSNAMQRGWCSCGMRITRMRRGEGVRIARRGFKEGRGGSRVSPEQK